MDDVITYPHDLVRTKLYRPATAASVVRRERLFRKLDAGRDLPLTLISAPAGSGKSTLVAEWLQECTCRRAWISLDQNDSELPAFLSYFVAAIRSIVPHACAGTKALLQSPEFPPSHIVANLLLNEIDALADDPALGEEGHFVLVLDDFYLIRGQAISMFLTSLLEHPTPVMRLVIVTRNDPALPLPVLRARNKLLEIRSEHLRFTIEETVSFLQVALDTQVSIEQAKTFEERTEGWVTGMRLAAMSMPPGGDFVKSLAEIGEGDRLTTDYLMDEVLSKQTPEIQEFLLKTSVLDRLSGPLCDAIMGWEEGNGIGQSFLQELYQKNLFVIALDPQGDWYRYHHLFQSLLSHRLQRLHDQPQIVALHTRASAWYDAAGLVGEAITHALAADDVGAAMQILERHRHAAMNQEHWQDLERWSKLLPRTQYEERIELQLLEAWILFRRWRLGDIPAHYKRIVALMEQKPPAEPQRTLLRGEIDALRSLIAYYTLAPEQGYAHGLAALKAVPIEYSYVRGIAWLYYAGALQLRGDLQQSRAAMLEGLKEDALHGNGFTMPVFVGLCVLEWFSGDMSALQQVANQLFGVGINRNLNDGKTWALFWRGCAYYQTNDLVAAKNDFAAVIAQRYIAYSMAYSQSVLGLASIYIAQGEFSQARALIESLLSYAMELNNTRVYRDAQCFLAYLALRQGHEAEAQRWAAQYDLDQPIPPLSTFYVPTLAVARILLSSAEPASLENAASLLRRLEEMAISAHNVRHEIEILALQALLHGQQGDEETALRLLGRSVTLAESGRLLRVFLDMGPTLMPLLARLRQQKVAIEFIDQVLAADAVERAVIPTSAPNPTPTTLLEPLSSREMDVLELLALRRTNKEIAAELYISERTVMRHTANLYQKLGVNKRQDAVTMAYSLGILADSDRAAGK